MNEWEQVIPKKENEAVGFRYVFNEEKSRAYQKLSLREKLEWLQNLNEFMWLVQTPEERERVYKLKGKITRM